MFDGQCGFAHQYNDDGQKSAAHPTPLGALAYKMKRSELGIRLVALGFIIAQSIGSQDANKILPNLAAMASNLNYTQAQFEAMMKEVAEAYQKDQGWGLIHAAFPEA